MPVEIEEAAFIDGCNPLQTYFKVVLPIMKPTIISVGILEIMWVWNDYLLPYLVLDLKRFKTIPIVIQYLKGGYGTVDMAASWHVSFWLFYRLSLFILFVRNILSRVLLQSCQRLMNNNERKGVT